MIDRTTVEHIVSKATDNVDKAQQRIGQNQWHDGCPLGEIERVVATSQVYVERSKDGAAGQFHHILARAGDKV